MTSISSVSTSPEDMLPSQILDALIAQGHSLEEVSRLSGLTNVFLAEALAGAWPKGEQQIAKLLNIHPSVIWPSRYLDPETGKVMRRSEKIRKLDALLPREIKQVMKRSKFRKKH
ncbi:DNA-binding transcriptional regulator Nlp [Buttiauxella agrestis]|uniref:DNA-binding transcriptional regulator Nlp n=1 Tax=Buttiauxella agrestis TaxID=82977 RepID=A0A381KNX7_9ENTR|nr:helix-turn-helix domain-containing protein [Buttiauxella agrestis]SUY92702.1 DNA-binding transcriptional regulator Nlp [Buttiauxella agrestis]